MVFETITSKQLTVVSLCRKEILKSGVTNHTIVCRDLEEVESLTIHSSRGCQSELDGSSLTVRLAGPVGHRVVTSGHRRGPG